MNRDGIRKRDADFRRRNHHEAGRGIAGELQGKGLEVRRFHSKANWHCDKSQNDKQRVRPAGK
jgi:hypothetical protein